LKKAHGKKPMMVFGHMVAFAHAHVKIVLTTKKNPPTHPPKKGGKKQWKVLCPTKGSS
jgi:hypothetical protein